MHWLMALGQEQAGDRSPPAYPERVELPAVVLVAALYRGRSVLARTAKPPTALA